MAVFAPDSLVWFGIVLGLVGRRFFLLFTGALTLIINDAAQRLVDRRAHARAVRDLRAEAQEEVDS